MVYYFSQLQKNTFRILIKSHKVRALNTSGCLKNHTRNYSYVAPMYKNIELYEAATGIAMSAVKQGLIKFASHHGTDLSELMLKGKILDVGCGPGTVTKYLTRYLDTAAKMDAFDISEELIEYAKNKFENCDLKFFVMDAEKDVPDDMIEKYDFIISNIVLQWAQEHGNILRNMVKMLKPKRDNLLVFYSKHPIYTTWRELSKSYKWSRYMKDVEDFIPIYQDMDGAAVHFKRLMIECGFQRAHVEEVEVAYRYRNWKNDLYTFRSLFEGINPFTLRIPNAIAREMFANDMMICFIQNGGFKNYDLSKPYFGESLVYNGSLIIAIGST